MRSTLLLVALLAVAGSASAQWWSDDFNDKDLVGWKLDRGVWTATNANAQADTTSTWQYATRPDLVVQDCCVECDVTHPVNGLMFAGVAIRVNNPTGGSLGQDLIMAKLQGSNVITQMWLYSITAAGANQAGSTSTLASVALTTGRVRLSAIGANVLAEWDQDGNGTWDRPLAHVTTVAVKPGPIGINGYRAGIVDNVRVFNAAMMPAVGAPNPTPGGSAAYDLGGPAGNSYQAAVALGNAGIPVGPGKSIPLSADGLFFASLFGGLGNLSGTLSATGTGGVKFGIPNIPALVGVSYYTAFVTYDKAGLTAIGNDVRSTIS